MLSKIIEFLSMPFVVLRDGGFSWLSLFGVVSGLFPPVLDALFVPGRSAFYKRQEFTINQLHVRFYYKMKQALLQCGTICITKWSKFYKVEQYNAQ